MGSVKHTTEKALHLLRQLPRVSLANIRDNPNSKRNSKLGRAQHGGDKHGAGNKGSGQRQNFMRIGYETGNNPFYLRFPYEPYYQGHHVRRQYPPVSMLQLQTMLDTDRLDAGRPIDLTQLCGTGLVHIRPDHRHFGVQLTDEGADVFKTRVNLEVQHASELVIATVERLGGVIRTAYYDSQSIWAMRNPSKWFEKGVPLPRRMLPPQDAIEYYTSAANRGYLADPAAIAADRLRLAQKYGYELPAIEAEMLKTEKDPRQIFYGLQPGWVVSVKDRAVIKPAAEQ